MEDTRRELGELVDRIRAARGEVPSDRGLIDVANHRIVPLFLD